MAQPTSSKIERVELNIRVDTVGPKGFDVVFTSTDQVGGIGALTQHVAEELGIDPPSFDVSKGHDIHPIEGGPLLVAIVTVGGREPEVLLRENFDRALKQLDLSRRRVWIPLMGTGAGKMRFEASAKVIVGTLLSHLRSHSEAVIAVPTGSDDLLWIVEDNIKGLREAGHVRESIEKVQTAINGGSDSVTIDGIWGPETAQALARFLAERGVEFDFGENQPDSNELDRLLAELSVTDAIPDQSPDSHSRGNRRPGTGGGKTRRPGSATAREAKRESREADPTPYYADHAARRDRLNREAIAETIAVLVENVWADRGGAKEWTGNPEARPELETAMSRARTVHDQSFMIHLHGRWGSGKSSVLNFLARHLLDRDLAVSHGQTGEVPKPPWIVVDYNAWQNAGRGPAWWTIMDTVYRAACHQLQDRPYERKSLRRGDTRWRLKAAWLPQIVAVLIAAGAAVIALTSKSDLLTGIGYVTAGAAAVMAVSNLLPGLGLFNGRMAKAYTEAARDPIGPLTRRYNEIVRDSRRPIAVFVDDLDRCEADFVVEVLQTIQTLFREARVLYVVAADRDWICSAYEQSYGEFMEQVGEPGRSLGHMFVEKVFQLSIEVPQLSATQLLPYWKRLVDAEGAARPLDDAERQKIVEEVDAKLKNTTSQAEAQSVAETYEGEKADVARSRVAVHVQVSPELRREREHFLLAYAEHLEPNPRALKRLVNAYGYKLAQRFQRRDRSDPDALVRWTIIENRWPLLASALTARMPLPGEMQRLLESHAVEAVTAPLNEATLANIVSDPEWVARQLGRTTEETASQTADAAE